MWNLRKLGTSEHRSELKKPYSHNNSFCRHQRFQSVLRSRIGMFHRNWLKRNFDTFQMVGESIKLLNFSMGFNIIAPYLTMLHINTLRNRKSQNGSPRRAIWLSVTQFSLELHFGATLHNTLPKHLAQTALLHKRERFSKLLSKRAILALFFSQCRSLNQWHIAYDPWNGLSIIIIIYTYDNFYHKREGGGWKMMINIIIRDMINVVFGAKSLVIILEPQYIES